MRTPRVVRWPTATLLDRLGDGAEAGWLRDGRTWWLTVMARLMPGQTRAQVNARLEHYL